MRNNGESMSKRRGCDHQVSCADEVAASAQPHMPVGVNIGDQGIERQAGEQRAKRVGNPAIFLGLRRQQRSGQKLGPDNRADKAMSARGWPAYLASNVAFLPRKISMQVLVSSKSRTMAYQRAGSCSG